jgi:hypothetical protein
MMRPMPLSGSTIPPWSPRASEGDLSPEFRSGDRQAEPTQSQLHPVAGVTKIHLTAKACLGEAATLWIEDPMGRITRKAEAEW